MQYNIRNWIGKIVMPDKKNDACLETPRDIVACLYITDHILVACLHVTPRVFVACKPQQWYSLHDHNPF